MFSMRNASWAVFAAHTVSPSPSSTRVPSANNFRALLNSPLIASSTEHSTEHHASIVGSSPADSATSRQRTIPSAAGSGPKTALINNQIQTGKSKGMISMDQSLAELVRNNVVLPEEALDRAIDRETFKTMLAGLHGEGRSASAPPRPGSVEPAPTPVRPGTTAK